MGKMMRFREIRNKRKKENEIRQLFQKDASREYICAERREAAILRLLDEAAGKYPGGYLPSGHRFLPLPSFAGQLTMHLKYMDKRLYFLQLVLLLAAVILYSTMGFKNTGTGHTNEPAFAFVMLSCVAFSTAAVSACKISDRHGMAELAGSCYFNHRQVCVLRMALSGILSLFSIGILLCAVHSRVRSPIWQVGIYFLVPYLVTGCFQFALLATELFGRSLYSLLAGGCVMELVFAFIASRPKVYEQAATGLWMLVMLASFAILTAELAVILKKIEQGDLLCMN